ncbi:hypothetical protein EDB81DRAFT_464578 [Dactylonectria macrodidyma]|uniref:Uncharacterized protein n=1 Tax=Dactylonectria macrodidyma TaxID=307937 RepID=A0A9P9EYV3_9HYPO|nr:hypothetical protein EDB81DRAFT_464578 [Dactylonectria macrodidyma]
MDRPKSTLNKSASTCWTPGQALEHTHAPGGRCCRRYLAVALAALTLCRVAADNRTVGCREQGTCRHGNKLQLQHHPQAVMTKQHLNDADDGVNIRTMWTAPKMGLVTTRMINHGMMACRLFLVADKTSKTRSRWSAAMAQGVSSERALPTEKLLVLGVEASMC